MNINSKKITAIFQCQKWSTKFLYQVWKNVWFPIEEKTFSASQLTLTYSKTTIETIKKDVKDVQS